MGVQVLIVVAISQDEAAKIVELAHKSQHKSYSLRPSDQWM